MKLGDLKGALLDTEFAVREWENNVKALFRQGQVGDFSETFGSSAVVVAALYLSSNSCLNRFSEPHYCFFIFYNNG